jgi:hypothetical protein
MPVCFLFSVGSQTGEQTLRRMGLKNPQSVPSKKWPEVRLRSMLAAFFSTACLVNSEPVFVLVADVVDMVKRFETVHQTMCAQLSKAGM